MGCDDGSEKPEEPCLEHRLNGISGLGEGTERVEEAA